LIRGLAAADLDDVLRLNYRCFENGENYTKHTFSYLLSQPNAVCFQVVTAEGRMVAFLCVLVGNDCVAHITTIGVAPEHRRRGLGAMLLDHLTAIMAERKIGSVVLEVRVGKRFLPKCCTKLADSRSSSAFSNYYNNGEDGFLMMRAVN
jgi:ribosomal-protein-alanine N-acetyltransferase